MIDQWIKEIKKESPADMLGMILSHNGIVRATAKNGGKVQAMNLSYDKKKLENAGRTIPQGCSAGFSGTDYDN